MFKSGIHKHERRAHLPSIVQNFPSFLLHTSTVFPCDGWTLSTEKHTLLSYLWDMFCSSVLEAGPDRHRSVRDSPVSYSGSSPSRTPSPAGCAAARRGRNVFGINSSRIYPYRASHYYRRMNWNTTVLLNSTVQFQLQLKLNVLLTLRKRYF